MTIKYATSPVRVDKPKWEYSGPQVWYDPWVKTERVLDYCGACCVCNRRTYGFRDGYNDPRGVLGDRATHALVASEHGMLGRDVPMCAWCGNDYNSYHSGLNYAIVNVWRHPPQGA